MLGKIRGASPLDYDEPMYVSTPNSSFVIRYHPKLLLTPLLRDPPVVQSRHNLPGSFICRFGMQEIVVEYWHAWDGGRDGYRYSEKVAKTLML